MKNVGVNQLNLIGRVTHSLMGYRDIILAPKKKLFFSVTSDMSVVSRWDSYITNMNMPWDKQTDQVLLSVGCMEAWVQTKKGVDDFNYDRLWHKNFKSQAICIHYNKKLGMLCTGCDNGEISILKFDAKSPLKYKVVMEEKIHQKRVMGIFTDTKRQLLFSIGEDGIMSVYNLRTNSLTAGKPPLTPETQVSQFKLTCMSVDPELGVAFVADKKGTIFIFDILAVSFQLKAEPADVQADCEDRLLRSHQRTVRGLQRGQDVRVLLRRRVRLRVLD